MTGKISRLQCMYHLERQCLTTLRILTAHLFDLGLDREDRSEVIVNGRVRQRATARC